MYLLTLSKKHIFFTLITLVLKLKCQNMSIRYVPLLYFACIMFKLSDLLF